MGQRLLLGELDRETLVSLDLNGSCFQREGKLAESFKLRQKCLEYTTKALPEKDPASFVANSNFVSLYIRLGQYDRAVECWTKSLDLCERSNDLDHRNSVMTLANMVYFFTTI